MSKLPTIIMHKWTTYTHWHGSGDSSWQTCVRFGNEGKPWRGQPLFDTRAQARAEAKALNEVRGSGDSVVRVCKVRIVQEALP